MAVSSLANYGRVFCLISGSSRGLGRGLALKLANILNPGSMLFLLARNTNDLVEIKKIVLEKNCSISISTKSIDLSNIDYTILKQAIEDALREANVTPDQFDSGFVIHNVGSVGDITKTILDITDAKEIENYFDLNLFSVVLLNSAFFRIFSSDVVNKQLVINISSLAAIQPMKTMGLYCTGKAARDMFFRVLAAEFPGIRVLNYAPGPLKTEMTTHLRKELLDDNLRKWFNDALKENKLLDVDFTVDKLVSVLELDKFENGAHIDVYDV